MKTIKFLILGLVFITISSCNKDDDALELNETNFLIFGYFYGECIGKGCFQTYKLTDKKLYKNSNHNYSGTNFNFSELENDKFKKIKDLINYFPDQLLNANKSVFGCPDCYDQGGLYIQFTENGNVKSWRIDQSKRDVPDYLHDFMDKVNEKIDLINN